MAKKELMIVADYAKEHYLTMEEVCRVCRLSLHDLQELVDYDVIRPSNKANEWVFDLDQLKRLQTALRLRRDLEVNVSGVALVLDLLDELERMRSRMQLLERHFMNW